MAVLLIFLNSASAQVLSFWSMENFRYLAFSDPVQACDYFYSDFYAADLKSSYRPDWSYFDSPTKFLCGINHFDESAFGTVNLMSVVCNNDESYDFYSQTCQPNGQKGGGQDPLICPSIVPSSVVGNPISAATGNKFQAEYDLSVGGRNPLVFYHYYNSSDQHWSHSYSAHLNVGDDSIAVVQADGRETIFMKGVEGYVSSTDFGSLSSSEHGYIYEASDGVEMSFDTSGRLVTIVDSQKNSQYLTYAAAAPYYVISIVNDQGAKAQITESVYHEPVFIAAGGAKVSFTYSHSLDRVEKVESGVSTARSYEYVSVGFRSNLLSAVIDERGIKYVTWNYDFYGRAISSQHAGGANITSLTYDDGKTTVTNGLGRRVAYHFQDIHGIQRIVAIEGEPSPNCSASNSSYTYNDRGQVLTKTDALGLVTTYGYNDRGLEISRTEASGTPLARTTTTEWDPVRFLRTQVVEPTRTTLYTYDGQGRALSQQVIPH